MKVSVDVYTKDVEAGLAAFKLALDSGATDAQLRSNEDWETKKFESLNLMFEADHNSDAISNLDDGPFARDVADLK
jgi:hypothetical protein